MKKLMFAALLAALLSYEPWGAKAADSYIMVPTTPDLSVSGLATASFVIDQISGVVSWVHIRNDCDTTLYFDLNAAVQFTKSAATTQIYPIRLAGTTSGGTSRDTQWFEGPFRMKTLGVSNDTNNTCTFSLIVGHQ